MGTNRARIRKSLLHNCFIIWMNEWRHSEVRSGTVIRPVRYKLCARPYSTNVYLFIRVTWPHRKQEKPNKLFVCVKFSGIRTAQCSFGIWVAFVGIGIVPGWRLWHVFQFLWKHSHRMCTTVKRLLNGGEFLFIFSLPFALNSFYLLEIPFNSRYYTDRSG